MMFPRSHNGALQFQQRAFLCPWGKLVSSRPEPLTSMMPEQYAHVVGTGTRCCITVSKIYPPIHLLSWSYASSNSYRSQIQMTLLLRLPIMDPMLIASVLTPQTMAGLPTLVVFGVQNAQLLAICRRAKVVAVSPRMSRSGARLCRRCVLP
jgi:hypothetical protein